MLESGIQKWLNTRNNLFDRVLALPADSRLDELHNLVETLRGTGKSPEQPVRIVFAGQYSAGKSSILKAMTGDDSIETGAGITTDSVHYFNWNGVEIADTPGIHTGLRPDHDEDSYAAIASADLLVFVVTNELFDAHLASHFRRLAVEHEKAHEMMLVVNKMRRTATGNTVETQQIIRADLEAVVAPYTTEQLRLSFIDAQSVLDAGKEPDPEMSALLYRKSGFEDFLREFDDFIRTKGLLSRYTTPLYSLAHQLQLSLIAMEPERDEISSSSEKLLLQKRGLLVDSLTQLRRSMHETLQEATEYIRQQGRDLAENIHSVSDEKELMALDNASRGRVAAKQEVLDSNLGELVQLHFNNLGTTLQTMKDSHDFRWLNEKLGDLLSNGLESLNVRPELFDWLTSFTATSQDLGNWLLQNSFHPQTDINSFRELLNPKHYAGTAADGVLTDLAKLFNKPLSREQSVKLTKGVANVGRGLVIAGALVSAGLQMKQDADAAKKSRAMREERQTVRSGYNEYAHTLEQYYTEQLSAYTSTTIEKEINEVDEQLAMLRGEATMQQSTSRELVDLLAATQELIRLALKARE